MGEIGICGSKGGSERKRKENGGGICDKGLFYVRKKKRKGGSFSMRGESKEIVGSIDIEKGVEVNSTLEVGGLSTQEELQEGTIPKVDWLHSTALLVGEKLRVSSGLGSLSAFDVLKVVHGRNKTRPVLNRERE